MNARPYVVGILAFSLVIVTLLVGTIAFQKSYDANSRTFNETDAVTIDFQQNSTVETADVPTSFFDDETITTENGETLTEGTDYSWNTSNGEIQWFDTSKTASGEGAAVEFAYDGHTTTVAATHDIATTLTVALPALALMVLAIAGLGGAGVFLAKAGGLWSPRRY